jgi:hypothetical protein
MIIRIRPGAFLIDGRDRPRTRCILRGELRIAGRPLMGHFQQELIAGVVATVIGGLILAGLTGSGGASKFFRFVLIVGILGVIGVLVLSQMRGSGWRRRGDVPAVTQLTAVLAHANPPVIPVGAAGAKGAQPGPKLPG